MDARDYQLVTVIGQDGKPITLYSRKFTEVQTRHTVT